MFDLIIFQLVIYFHYALIYLLFNTKFYLVFNTTL